MTKYFKILKGIAHHNCSTIHFNVPPRIANCWGDGGWTATGRGSAEERTWGIIENYDSPQAGFSRTEATPHARPRVLKDAPRGQ